MHIYLSPHHDDVCFSLGHLACQTGGTLLNAFTISHYTAAPVDLPQGRDARIGFVSDLRRQEDLRFAETAGLSRHDLRLSEPPVLGLKPFDPAGMDLEVQDLTARLTPTIA